MKHLPGILLFAAVLNSCTPRTQCIDFRYYDFRFTRGTATDSIPDTSVIVTNYTKGSNFNTPLNSDTVRTGNELFQKILTATVQPETFSFASDQGSYTTLFDWKYIFLPSGKTYLMKNVETHSRSERQIKYEDHECFNNLTLTVNDSAYSYPGSTVSTAFVFIKY